MPLSIVNVTADKNEVIMLAEWLIAGGTSADAAYKKLKELIKADPITA